MTRSYERPVVLAVWHRKSTFQEKGGKSTFRKNGLGEGDGVHCLERLTSFVPKVQKQLKGGVQDLYNGVGESRGGCCRDIWCRRNVYKPHPDREEGNIGWASTSRGGKYLGRGWDGKRSHCEESRNPCKLRLSRKKSLITFSCLEARSSKGWGRITVISTQFKIVQCPINHAHINQ